MGDSYIYKLCHNVYYSQYLYGMCLIIYILLGCYFLTFL